MHVTPATPLASCRFAASSALFSSGWPNVKFWWAKNPRGAVPSAVKRASSTSPRKAVAKARRPARRGPPRHKPGPAHIRLVTGHAVSIQQLDQLYSLIGRGLFARDRVGGREHRKPATCPSKDRTGALDPGQGLGGGHIVRRGRTTRNCTARNAWPWCHSQLYMVSSGSGSAPAGRRHRIGNTDHTILLGRDWIDRRD